MLDEQLKITTQNNDNPYVDAEEILAEVDKRIKSQEVLLRDLHRQWFVNVAMRRGLQYIQTHSGTGLVAMPPDSEDRVRIVVNKMMGIHQTRVAKLAVDLPKLEVIPSTGQEEDKDLARKGTKLLSWLWANQQMVTKMVDALSWMIDAGNCFLYVFWDTEKGQKITTYQRHEGPIDENMPHRMDEEGYILDENGERIPQEVTIGDVGVEILAPFDIINDGVSETIQDSQWIIIQKAMSLTDIRMIWGERGKQVRPERDLNSRAYFQRRLQTMVGNQSTYFAPEPKQYEEMAIVKTMFEKPTDKYPKGRRVVTANGVLLETGGMPYVHGLYPLIKIGDIKVSGSFWDVSTMENLIPVQKGYNRTWSQIIENANNMGNIKVVLTKGHGLQKEAYDDTGTEILELDEGGNFISQLQPAQLPAYVVNQLQWYDRAFEDVSGMHEVSNARVPSGAQSAKALMVLQEQDDTRLAPTKIRFHRAMEELGSMALQLYAEFQDEDRDYQLIGDASFDIDEFTITKDDIASMKKDVRVQGENLIGAHKRLQQDSVLEMYEKGLFGDKNNTEVRKKVLDLLEFGSVSSLFDEINLDRSQARKENQQFINSEELIQMPSPFPPLPGAESLPQTILSIPAYDFEDHEVHIETHNSLRKSPRYRAMTEPLRRGLDAHVKIHENFVKGLANGLPAPTPKMLPPPPPPPSGMMPPGAPAPVGQGLPPAPPQPTAQPLPPPMGQ